jgi:hypothetical protein
MVSYFYKKDEEIIQNDKRNEIQNLQYDLILSFSTRDKNIRRIL